MTELDIVLTEKIQAALDKTGADKSLMLCKYIPNSSNTGHMHHFSLEKVIRKTPEEAIELISKYILQPKAPCILYPKARFPKTKKHSKKSNTQASDSLVQSLLIKAIESKNDDLLSEILNHKDNYIQELKNKIIYCMRNEEKINLSYTKMYNELIDLR
ncbi:MAG: hypothetical protein KAH32_01455 [Chlamydiia bacterium]|nr:hypothetical protein [Chlamydiia bacterium]